MKRLHLVELEDLDWFPKIIRDGGTAFLRATAKYGKMERGFAEPLKQALRKTGHTEIVDLCSGGAGPLPEVLQALVEDGMDVKATMTDKYPNQDAFRTAVDASSGRISFEPASVDATDVPAHLNGFRTIFNAFHHFPPELAQSILADAVHKRTPIGVFEIVERSLPAIIAVMFAPLMAMLMMPTVRPVRPAMWLLTYIIPAIPLLVLWDGLVSCMRVYSPDELRELIDGIKGSDTFDWQIEKVRMFPLPGRLTVLIGTPKT